MGEEKEEEASYAHTLTQIAAAAHEEDFMCVVYVCSAPSKGPSLKYSNSTRLAREQKGASAAARRKDGGRLGTSITLPSRHHSPEHDPPTNRGAVNLDMWSRVPLRVCYAMHIIVSLLDRQSDEATILHCKYAGTNLQKNWTHSQ